MSHFLHGRRRDSDRCRHFEAKGRAVRRTVPNSSHYTGHQTPSTKHTATFEWLTIWQTYAKARNSDIQFRLTDNYWIIWLISWNFTWDKPVCCRWASAPDRRRFGNNHWRKPAKFCWLPLHNREHKLICWPWLLLALREPRSRLRDCKLEAANQRWISTREPLVRMFEFLSAVCGLATTSSSLTNTKQQPKVELLEKWGK